LDKGIVHFEHLKTVKGTALDVLANTEYLIVGGSNQISLYLMGSSSTSTITKIRTNRSLVRLLKFNPVIATGRFASVVINLSK